MGFEKLLDPTTKEGESYSEAAQTVKMALSSVVSPTKDKEIEISSLVSALEKTIKSKESKFVNEVYGGAVLGTPQQKLWKIMCYLNKKEKGNGNPANNDQFVKSLDRTTLQDFLKYLNDVDSNTKLETKKQNFEKQAADYLDSALDKVNDIWNKDPKLSSLATLDAAGFESAMTKIGELEWVIRSAFSKFKNIEELLPKEFAKKQNDKWNTLHELRKKLVEEKIIEKWKSQRALRARWEAAGGSGAPSFVNNLNSLKTEAELFSDQRMSLLSSGQRTTLTKLKGMQELRNEIIAAGGTAATGPIVATADSVKGLFQESLAFFTQKALQDSDSGIADAARSELNTRLREYLASPKKGSSDFEVRFRGELKKDFLKEQEAQLAQNLKENTESQWEILQKRPEGEFVKIRYYNMLASDMLPSAKELDSFDSGPPLKRAAPEESNLKIISKTKSGVVLQNVADSKTFVLSGPTEKKDGKWSPNLGIFNGSGSDVQPNNADVMGVVLSINLGA